MKTSILIVTVISFLGLTNYCCTNTNIPKDFVESAPSQLKKESYSNNKFGVEINNGKLKIKKVNDTNECGLIISNGKLIGIDRGEWGGKLSFTPNDKSKKSFQIKEGNIKFIFKLSNNLYFIEGLAHDKINEGTLYKLVAHKNSFSYKKIYYFNEAPEVFKIFQNKLIIATKKNLYSFHNLKKVLI
ncbi:hypothetical protein [Pedobacter alpinus]|uniref:Uncharacterized protein n=1 Tax=Pedobacter alpinus TaxID=1590643 RepID=A0ABW5TST4_9SPHI